MKVTSNCSLVMSPVMLSFFLEIRIRIRNKIRIDVCVRLTS